MGQLESLRELSITQPTYIYIYIYIYIKIKIKIKNDVVVLFNGDFRNIDD